MQMTMLKGKLHKARVTQTELEYEGSCAIDLDLLEAAGICEYEQIHVYNIENGERFVTYAIIGERGSRMISMNGAAAHKCNAGDRVIICAYAGVMQEELTHFQPRLVYLDEGNCITQRRGAIPLQVA
ncbi:aspartate 1-decarboxylase [Halorhodospira abdelmalekii]|uniref:aspartate 1-decarboxylase n=1 Tax=Halorhodospira abdelmalekii TaxID=421629 RepID=UPI0019038FE8|nr:aspartate 1-decarboxylase [Halorhodospira abdelmalekii]MBK1734808.1 aspartate 1-decarboxylase [Halorhodospira abdelmalekii]